MVAEVFEDVPECAGDLAARREDVSLTRPLGATLGDTLTKPPAEGGLGLGRIGPSLVIAVAMVVLIAVTSLRKRAIAIMRA